MLNNVILLQQCLQEARVRYYHPLQSLRLGTAVNLETVWYESAPYLYMVVGLISVFRGSVLAQVSGLLLITASLTILRLRWVYRRKQDAKVESAIHQSPPAQE